MCVDKRGLIMKDEKQIDQEVRIRVLEKVAEDIRTTLHHLDTKMDSQFKWIMGIMITMFGGLILTKII